MTSEPDWAAAIAKQLEAERRAKKTIRPPVFNPEQYDILRRDLTYIELDEATPTRRKPTWAQLQVLLEHQLRHGCGNLSCTQPACRTYRLRSGAKPLRQLTQASISATALMLSQEPAAARHLCLATASLPNIHKEREALPEKPADPSSFVQTLFTTSTMRAALDCPIFQSDASVAKSATPAVKPPRKIPVLCKLEIDTIQLLVKLINAPHICAIGQSTQIWGFFRLSCKHVLGDPWRIHTSFRKQSLELLLKDLKQRSELDSRSFGRRDTPQKSSCLKQRESVYTSESAMDTIHDVFGNELVVWLTRATTLLGCTPRSQDADFGASWPLYGQPTLEAARLDEVLVSTLRMVSKVIETATNSSTHSRNFLTRGSKVTPSSTQVLDTTILDLAQTIANRLAPYHCIPSASLQASQSSLCDVHERVRSKLLSRLTRPLYDMPQNVLDSTQILSTESLQSLVLSLETLCHTGASGMTSVRCGSPLDNAISTLGQLRQIVAKSRGPITSSDYWNPAVLSGAPSPLGGFCNPDELAKSWINPLPGHRSLLEYPFLFSGPETSQNTGVLVLSFRRICFMRMMKVYRSATLNNKMISAGFCWPTLAGLPDSREQLESLMYQHPPHGIKSALMPQLEIKIGRETILDDALNHMWRRQKRQLLAPLKVKFSDAGEIAADLGGVAQEFFRLIAEKMQSSEHGLFILNGPKQYAWFNPGSCEPTYRYCLLGMLVALAVHNGFTLPISFPSLLYRRLIDPSCDHGGLCGIEDGWPELVRGFRSLLEYDGDVEEDIGIDYSFAIAFPDGTVSLSMNDGTAALLSMGTFHRSPLTFVTDVEAPPVTNDNRQRYVSDYIKYLTETSVQQQLLEFCRGFHSIVDKGIVATLTWQALRALVEGHQDIDVHELRSATQYVQYDEQDPTIKMFWEYVGSLSSGRLKRLLEFVTATDRIPVNGLQSLAFTVQKHGEDDEHLPSASTCFGILLLPAYSSAEVLNRKMDLALDNADGFGLR